MYKTIVTLPNWQPPPLETLSVVGAAIDNLAAKYTGDRSLNIDANNVATVERWSWSDEATAQEYLTIIDAHIGPLYPGYTTTIVAE